jgi:hypothetical protein
LRWYRKYQLRDWSDMGCFVLLKVINFEVPISFYRWDTLRLKKLSEK